MTRLICLVRRALNFLPRPAQVRTTRAWVVTHLAVIRADVRVIGDRGQEELSERGHVALPARAVERAAVRTIRFRRDTPVRHRQVFRVVRHRREVERSIELYSTPIGKPVLVTAGKPIRVIRRPAHAEDEGVHRENRVDVQITPERANVRRRRTGLSERVARQQKHHNGKKPPHERRSSHRVLPHVRYREGYSRRVVVCSLDERGWRQR